MNKIISIKSKWNLAAIAAALLMMFSIMTMYAPSASANDSSTQWCGSASHQTPWKYASWGRGCAYYLRSESGVQERLNGGSHDTLTDGYCVEARRKKWSTWAKVSWSGSCGTISNWVTAWADYGAYKAARLYRGNGNYMTLWTR